MTIRRRVRRSRSRHIEFELSDQEWFAIARTLRGDPSVARQKLNGARRFLDAVLWVSTYRTSWYHLPICYGASHANYVRFTRWVQDGTLRKVVNALAASEDKQMAMETLRRFYAVGRETASGIDEAAVPPVPRPACRGSDRAAGTGHADANAPGDRERAQPPPR